MGGPSGHGQRNKAHKAGHKAGISARQKQKQGKEGPAFHRPSVKAAATSSSRTERLHATKQQRDTKRQELLDRKRHVKPPLVVAVLPLSADADVGRLWHGLLAACEGQGHYSSGSIIGSAAQLSDGMDLELAVLSGAAPCMTTVSLGGRGKQRVTLLPPLTTRSDPLAVVDMARAAEVVLLLVAGGEGQKQIDTDGELLMSILRAMGMPTLAVAVQASGSSSATEGSVNGSIGGRSQGGGGSTVAMKERSAARKRAEKVLAAQAPGEHKLLHADNTANMQQIARHLAEVTPVIPLWRLQRPSLLVEDASFEPSTSAQDQSLDSSAQQPVMGTLLVHTFVRCAGLSANRLITIPGAGDYQISEIRGPADPHMPQPTASTSAPAGAEVSMVELDNRVGTTVGRLLAKAGSERESLVRENEPDPLAGEQTWPSAQELLDAEALYPQSKRRRLPAGTSEYQAAWILDEDGEVDDALKDEDEGDETDVNGKADAGPKAARGASGASNGGSRAGSNTGGGHLDEDADDMPELESMSEDDGTGVHGMDTDGGHDDDEEDDKAATAAALAHKQQKAEAAERDFPDEVDTPLDTPARVRFQKFRGLKSFRSSPWDPKESLPPEYGRVFAFENFKRAHKRAAEAMHAATDGSDPTAVVPGSWVVVHVENVPASAAESVIQRVRACASGCAAPLVATGLMAHEGRMSVVNFSVKKAASYTPVLANKEELLLVTGVRSFMSRPILSTDNHGADKHKLERYLQPGAHAIASCYAPICYGPLPLLAFKLQSGGRPAVLAASGSLRSCDPDRVVLKKVVLSGYPVRVHKKRATVRFMFHHPEDIRWFQPVELFTKTGRRGRIAEPLGTHGGMKCLFDGPVQQFDSVGMALYKRSFPRWPADTSYAAFA